MAGKIVLKFDQVLKEFGPVRALKEVSFDVLKGEVHCLVGENGAGKSTLMKILSGAYNIDGGSIFIDEKRVHISGPAGAAKLGVAVVYQEMNVVSKLTVVDNMMLGHEFSRLGFNQLQKNIDEVIPYLRMVRLEDKPTELMENLSIAQKQMVMIAKALMQHAKIIILDEPTAMLNEREVQLLFDIIGKLKERDITVIYISHRMEEIYQIGDRVTVLKDGGYVGTYEVRQLPVEQLIVKMVGRELKEVYPSKSRPIGEEILRVEGIFNEKLQNISFTLRRGEVLGLSGLVGSGRTEVLRAVFGADRIDEGTVYLNGERMDDRSPKASIRHRMGLVPEDRKGQGIIGCLSVKENMTLIYSQLHARLGFRSKKGEDGITSQFIRRLDIKTPSESQLVGRLSGGNQQKVVLSKWLSVQTDILLLDEPTQGIDVGAKAEIYQLIDRLARSGMGVLVVSSDLVEIIHLCNRILVMREGSITGEVTEEDMTEDRIMLYAMGVRQDEKNEI